jgi:hypothetical protein
MEKNVYKIKTISELKAYKEKGKNREIYTEEELGLPETIMLRDEEKGIDYFFNVNGNNLQFDSEEYPDKL